MIYAFEFDRAIALISEEKEKAKAEESLRLSNNNEMLLDLVII